MTQGPYDEPSDTTAEQGAVVVKGPDGVDVTLTPEAAEETSDRLLQGAAQATGQRLEASKDRWKEIDRG